MNWDKIREVIDYEFDFAEEHNINPPIVRIDLDSGESIEIWYNDSLDFPGYQFTFSFGESYEELDSLCDAVSSFIEGQDAIIINVETVEQI